MNKLREAAELALKALEETGAEWIVLERKARIALRQALAEKQECETCAAKRKRLTKAGLLKSPLRSVDAEPESVDAEPESVDAEPESVDAEPESVDAEPDYEPVEFTKINSIDVRIGTNEVMRVTGDGITLSDRVVAIDTSESYVDQNEKREHEPVAVMRLEKGGWDLIDSVDVDWLETLPVGTTLYFLGLGQKPWGTSDMAYRPGGLSMDQEPWVSLTDDEVRNLRNESELLDMFENIGWYSAPRSKFNEHSFTLIRAIEAKLKELNHG